MPDSNTFLHFAPELILTTGILVVLLYDLAVRGRDAWQPWITGFFLLAALAATFYLFSQPASPIFVAPRVFGDGAIVPAGAYVSDGFTQFFRLTSLITTLLVFLSGVAYMRGRTPFRGEFFAFLLGCALAMNLMAGANDLILVALAIEFLSITSYILTAYLRGDRLSSEAGLKYFLYGSITSAVMLFGLSLLYGATGSTSIPALAAYLRVPQNLLVAGVNTLAIPALLMVLVGLAFKIALVPFHQWSPDAYEGAPTPVTAFFATAPKVGAMALFARLLHDAFGPAGRDWGQIVAFLAVASMFLGAVAAIGQRDIKRLMAYSSIGHMGFALVGLAAGSATGVQAMLVYLAIYVTMNVGVFAFILSMERDGRHVTDIASLSLLARAEPTAALALLILLFSLAGVPPLVGFFAKYGVLVAAVQADMVWLALAGVIASVIGAFYYLRIVYLMYFGQEGEGLDGAMSWSQRALLVAAAAVMLVGVVNLFGIEGPAAAAAAALVR